MGIWIFILMTLGINGGTYNPTPPPPAIVQVVENPAAAGPICLIPEGCPAPFPGVY